MTQRALHSVILPAVDEQALARLADLVAFSVRTGDLIALSGDLGAGKTTFARAFIEALVHPATVEVPSPTFTLVQTYQTPRIHLAHFDLYRLQHPAELNELGLDDTLQSGAAIVEWPERGQGLLTGTRLDIALTELPDQPDARTVTLRGTGSWVARLQRLERIRSFLVASGYATWQLRYLQGDASVRRYARLFPLTGQPLVLMDWPPQPDGPPIRDGLPYSRIAHLAEGVRPFVAIASALETAGFSVPQVFAHDLEAGLLVLEDFGDRVFGVEMRTDDSAAHAAAMREEKTSDAAAGPATAPTKQHTLWQAGVDTLVALRAYAPPETMALTDGSTVTMPTYDAQALGIETELLLDWYWPALHGTPVPADMRTVYMAHWAAIFARLATLPHGWALRDYHSPNLLWLPDRSAPNNVGIIDFQDAQRGPHAYDLVSLLQDARVDVPAALEAALLTRYCDGVAARDPAFQQASFRWSYAALGAQRNAKILGIFARLAHRDGKPAYLAHIPRIWSYLARDLAHPELSPLNSWFTTAFPPLLRARPIAAVRPLV